MGWDELDDWLEKYGKLNHSFSAEVLGASLGISTPDASTMIQQYLAEQRRGEKARTGYVLKRRGRTRAAVWTVGEKTKDARRILRQYDSDIRRTFWRAVEPDLLAIAEINPQARKMVEQKLEAIMDSMFTVMSIVLDGALPPDDE